MVATDREEASIRVSRQRSAITKQVPSESFTAATQDALEHPNSPLQNENQIDIGDEGKWFSRTYIVCMWNIYCINLHITCKKDQ